MARYHGKGGRVYISTSGAGTASNVISLSQWSLDFSKDQVEASAFNDANKVYLAGLKDTRGTFEGLWDDAEDKPWSALDSTTGINMYLYPSSTAMSKYFYGTADLDMSISVAVNAAVRISSKFVALTDWGRK